MLTGQTPFHAENYEGWARQHQTTPPPPPSALRPDLANWQGLDALVQRLLAKDREDRPKDVAELSGLLDEVRYVSRYARMETVNEANNHFQGSDLFSKQHKISSRLAVSVLAIGVVFMIAFVVWAIATQQSGKPTNMTAQTQPVVQPQMQTNADTIQVPKGLTPNPPVHVPKGFTLIEPAGDEQKAEALYKQKNYSDARIHFESACNDGQMKACSYLGYFYAQGLGGARDTQKAQDVYQKACSQGNMSSCASLGSIFQDAGNSNEASKYFQIACNGGMVKACDLLRGVQ
jgi:serine/threonine protein kinase